MRTSIINADKAKKYRIFYKIVAAAVWIMVWQLTSMYLKQEILLASPVSVIMKYQGQKAESRSCLHDKTFELGPRQT